MSTTAKSTFTITEWKDTSSGALGGETKLTLTHATLVYEGAIVGEGIVEYLMCAGAEGITHFTGFEKITGAFNGRTGSFIVQHTGTFAGEPKSTFKIVIGSGTGELAGLTGAGSYGAKDGIMEFLLTCD